MKKVRGTGDVHKKILRSGHNMYCTDFLKNDEKSCENCTILIYYTLKKKSLQEQSERRQSTERKIEGVMFVQIIQKHINLAETTFKITE